jgi:hypothetical protein
MPQPPTWRARVSLLVWPIAFDPSSMGGPTGNICYRRHGSQVHLGMQALPLRQSRDTSRGLIRQLETLHLQRALKVVIALSAHVGKLSSQLLTSAGFLNVWILRINAVKYILD